MISLPEVKIRVPANYHLVECWRRDGKTSVMLSARTCTCPTCGENCFAAPISVGSGISDDERAWIPGINNCKHYKRVEEIMNNSGTSPKVVPAPDVLFVFSRDGIIKDAQERCLYFLDVEGG